MINSIENVLQWIKPGDRVLDVGGGAVVFPRANAVIDLLAYEERQQAANESGEKNQSQQFGPNDWFVGDICAAEVWQNFKDKEFDFVVCSHTLEDIRDPIFVSSQLQRVGKAGYIETPSRFREGAKVNADDPITGWQHHRWILDVEDGTIVFTMKHPHFALHDFLGDARRQYAIDYYKQFTGIHWINTFNYVERIQKGDPVEVENMYYFYDTFDYNVTDVVHEIDSVPFKGKTIDWDDKLPIEKVKTIEQIVADYQLRMTKGFEKPSQTLPPQKPQGRGPVLSALHTIKQRLFPKP